MFDVTLEAFFGRHLLCIHAPTCGYGPALEHNGDLYSCDHFVEPKSPAGQHPQDAHADAGGLARAARVRRRQARHAHRPVPGCKVRHLCNGGCPKDRFALSKDGEPGQNYLCAGPRAVLHAHRPDVPEDGRAASAAPRAVRGHGVGRGRRRQARTVRTLPLRQRQEVSFLSRQREHRTSTEGESIHGDEETEHPHPLGRRHRSVQHQRLQPRHDGLQDAQHRPHRQRRRAVHRLVRPAELHRRPRRVHHRAVADPHRPDQGRPAGRARGHEDRRPDHRRACSRTTAT